MTNINCFTCVNYLEQNDNDIRIYGLFRMDPRLNKYCGHEAKQHCHAPNSFFNPESTTPELGPLIFSCLYRTIKRFAGTPRMQVRWKNTISLDRKWHEYLQIGQMKKPVNPYFEIQNQPAMFKISSFLWWYATFCSLLLSLLVTKLSKMKGVNHQHFFLHKIGHLWKETF